MKSKYDIADFKFIYENKVLTNSNHGNSDYKDPSAPYKELFWTSIKVSGFILAIAQFIQHATLFQNKPQTMYRGVAT